MSTWAALLPTFGLELVYWPSVAVFYPRLEHDYVKNERQSHIGRQLAESARPYPDKRGPDPTEREKKRLFKLQTGIRPWILSYACAFSWHLSLTRKIPAGWWFSFWDGVWFQLQGAILWLYTSDTRLQYQHIFTDFCKYLFSASVLLNPACQSFTELDIFR